MRLRLVEGGYAPNLKGTHKAYRDCVLMMWHRITHLDRGERLDRLCPDGHRSFEDPALWATEGRSLVAVINACGRMT